MNQSIQYLNKNAISIIRLSSKRQADGLSLNVQSDEIKSYCARAGLNLVEEFSIIESAKDSKKRFKYKDAIRFAEKNKIGNIVFYMADREARNLTDLEINEAKVSKGIFIIHYAKENNVFHRGSSDADLLTRGFNGLINKQYSKNLSTKVNDGMKKKAESGWFPSNNPPLGYICQKSIDPLTGRIKNRGGTIILDPNENNRKIVLREFELRANGLSFENIRETIIEEGLINSKSIKRYHASVIHRRLQNPFYRGQFLWQETLYNGNHELFIPKHILMKVDESFGLRPSSVRRDENEYTALSGGWLKCNCGCHVVYDPKKKINRKSGESKTYHYYHCTNGKRLHDSMSGMNVTNDQIWIQLGTVVNDIHISEQFAKEIADALNQVEDKAHSTTRLQIRALESKIEQLRKNQDTLFDMVLKKELEKEMFDVQLNRIRNEENIAIHQLESIQLALTTAVKETCQSVLELAKNAQSLWNSQSANERKKVLDMILSNPVLNGINIEYNLKKPFAILKEMNGNPEWRTLRDSNSRPTGSKPATLSN